MKQLLLLSGKGGTGKTTLAGAFIRLSGAQAFADCDVDAPNLHLILAQNTSPVRTDYFGMPKAEIDAGKCIECGLCSKFCRFEAISIADGYQVDSFACEGCGVCEEICPEKAVCLNPSKAGELMLHIQADKVFSTAQLKTGSGTSGKLVTQVKAQMKNAVTENHELAILDGSPGIGCPVIASLTGVDMVLIVAEPSVSGISDMERIVRTAEIFRIKTAVCINKYDTNPGICKKIEDYCVNKGLSLTGKIPFDFKAVQAVNSGRTVVDIDCPSGHAAKGVFSRTMKLLFQEDE